MGQYTVNALLEQLTRRQLIWPGFSQQAGYQPVSSGYPQFDTALGGGLPASGMIDIQSLTGIGELRLILPYLQQQQRKTGRLLVIIAPPAIPCADMLGSAGIDLQSLLIVQPANAKDALWAAEQCLHSGICQAVLLWQQKLQLHQARRLQLAAEQGNAALLLFRQQADGLSLPVNLSLILQPHRQGLSVTISKRKGGWPGQAFLLDLQQHWPHLTLQEQAESDVDQRQAG